MTVKKLYAGFFLLILALVPFHAFLSVWLGHLFGHDLLWKIWKELILALLSLVSLGVLWKRLDIRRHIMCSRINQLILLFIVIHLVGMAVFHPALKPLLAGLAIDLRFVVMFVVAQIAVYLVPSTYGRALKTSLIAAGIVVGFGLLQIFVLPRNFLAWFGYSKATIAPYLTVDQNPLFVRINSTLRGPNPVGQYALILLGLLSAWWLEVRHRLSRQWRWFAALSLVSLVILLGVSYSRSAWLGVVAAILSILAVRFRAKITPWVLVASLGVLVLLSGTYVLTQNTYVVQNIINHKNPNDPAGNDSNLGHINSLKDGTLRLLHEPLGSGPGTTGSASLYGNQPLVIENQFLFVAHEAGWAGLVCFVAICVLLGRQLWLQGRSDWLSLGLLAGLVGISVVGLLLPVWTDDTVSLVWWGLAGVAIARAKLQTH